MTSLLAYSVHLDLPPHRQHHQAFLQAERAAGHIAHHDRPACHVERLLRGLTPMCLRLPVPLFLFPTPQKE